MPYQQQLEPEWEPNELYLEHNGVRIFHVYAENMEGGKEQYVFGTASDTSINYDETLFNLFRFPGFDIEHCILNPEKQTYIKEFIKTAIDTGVLKPWIDAAAVRPKDVWVPQPELPPSPKFKKGDRILITLNPAEDSSIKYMGRIHEEKDALDFYKVTVNDIPGDFSYPIREQDLAPALLGSAEYPLIAIYDRNGFFNDMYQIVFIIDTIKLKSTSIWSKAKIMDTYSLTEDQFTGLLKPNEG